MLFHWLPITPSSGSGIHDGQNTGASMRFARRCQPASDRAGQRTCADALTESLAPQPASASASATRTPARLTAPLKPVNRDPGPGEPVTRLEVVDELRPRAQGVVERCLPRVVGACREHAVRDRARDDHVADALAPEATHVPVRIERALRAGQGEM